MGSQYNIGRLIGCVADYNSNNCWYFNCNNGVLNNNNRYNGNFRCRPFLDYGWYDNSNLDNYLIKLDEWLSISKDTVRGKSRKPCYVYFLLDRISELIKLSHEVGNCEVMPSESTAHIIFEPKIREIVCATAGKRVLQTFYIKSIQPYLERYLYHKDSYSCRKNMGSLKAIQRLQEYVFEESMGYKNDLWIAKVDIQAFFMQIDCFQVNDILVDFIKREMPEHQHKNLLLYLTRIIYLAATKDHLKDMARPFEREMLNPTKSLYNSPYYKGVPIGDWTSQTAGLIITTFSLRYLESLGYKFIHYTDDTVVLVKDKKRWLEDVQRLECYYENFFGLTLHPKKRYLQHYSKGVEALGYKVKFNRILPSDRIGHNIRWYIKRTKKKFFDKTETDVLPYADKIVATINSYLGLLRYMNGYRMRKWMCEEVCKGPIGKVIYPASDFCKISIREEFTKMSLYKIECKKIKKQIKIAA